MKQKNESCLEIHNLSVSFKMYQHGLKQTELKVISDLHLSVKPGEIVAIVGSSGSGKSLLANCILGLLPDNAIVSGHVHYQGQELNAKRIKELCGREIALVPQSVSYLDPLMKIGNQVDGHQPTQSREKRNKLFERLDLPQTIENYYPFQLSGGMIRRVLVSTALLSTAKLIIADEPTPGMSLHQALEALTMFKEMAQAGKSVILITHDVDLACEFADKIAVFYAGTILEIAPAQAFKNGPDFLKHPYSKALWKSLPQNGFEAIEGMQPTPLNLPKGCVFAPRCPFKMAQCEQSVPDMRDVGESEVRCFYGS